MTIKFLRQQWLGSRTFKEQYPDLYNIVRKKKKGYSSNDVGIKSFECIFSNVDSWPEFDSVASIGG